MSKHGAGSLGRQPPPITIVHGWHVFDATLRLPRLWRLQDRVAPPARPCTVTQE